MASSSKASKSESARPKTLSRKMLRLSPVGDVTQFPSGWMLVMICGSLMSRPEARDTLRLMARMGASGALERAVDANPSPRYLRFR